MLYFVFNEGVIAVIVAHDLAAGEFVAQVTESLQSWTSINLFSYLCLCWSMACTSSCWSIACTSRTDCCAKRHVLVRTDL